MLLQKPPALQDWQGGVKLASGYISLEHHVDGFECCWNGIEDLYMAKSGTQWMPSCFFMALSGLGEFSYTIQQDNPGIRMAMWNTASVKKMYMYLSPVAGFKYKFCECKDFNYIMDIIKENIDNGCPVMAGVLDMYYLDYHKKFWHKHHIPCHYILVSGYCDKKQCIYLYDNSLKEIQELLYSSLKLALDIKEGVYTDPCGIYCFSFQDNLPEVRELAVNGFRAKALRMLNPDKDTYGIKAMYRLSREFGQWKKEADEERFRQCLLNIIMYTGITIFADNLMPLEKRMDFPSCASRDIISANLMEIGSIYKLMPFIRAAGMFRQSGRYISAMTRILTDYLLNKEDALIQIPGIIKKIAEIEEIAYKLLASPSLYKK